MVAASLTLAAGSAVAATGATSGGTQAAGAAQVSTKAVQRARGIKAAGARGPQTRRVLKRFQRAHHIKPTGRVNPATLAALGLLGPQRNGSLAVATPTPDA